MKSPARILIYSHAFHPSVGGSENACRLLADGIAAAGHEVRIVTRSAGPATEPFPYPIHYSPSAAALLRLVRWSHVYVHSNISLRGGWPLLLLRRPWVVIHHSRITRVSGELIWIDHAKRLCTHFAKNIAVSRSMAADLPAPAEVIGNGYDRAIFHRDPGVRRDRDLVFLGRLNRDKGCHLLLEALEKLAARGRHPTLTIVGGGGAEPDLRRQVRAAGLDRQIVFAGPQNRAETARLLNAHRILVVPSLVQETFGLVVLEGIACGCGVIVSTAGALEEIAGPCGVSFPANDASALRARIEELLDAPARIDALQSHAEAHLEPFRSERICQRYLAAILSEVRLAAHSLSLLFLAGLL